jgi:diaminopimelate decarboxylase
LWLIKELNLSNFKSSNDGESKTKKARPSIDHVANVIADCFDVQDHELLVGGMRISQLVQEFGSPLYVYDYEVIANRIRTVRSFLPSRFKLFYSVKANPNAAILRCFLENGCGLEVASAGELYQALSAGCPADQVIFAGPGKTEVELAAAIDAEIHEIHVESIEEARCINRLAAARDRAASVALRVNPIDASGGAMRMGGKASPFGIDEEQLETTIDEILTLQNLNIQGVHLFMGTQILDARILIRQYQRAVSIAQQVAAQIGKPLRTIDFGGGLGTPYFAHETKLDLEIVAQGLASIDEIIRSDPLLSDCTAILEPGRFLVNEAGIFISKVMRVKNSRGKIFAVIDGGMHQHLAASGNLGQTIKRNYPIAILNKLGMPVDEPIDVVGPLCTPLDTIGRGIQLPLVEAQDLVGVFLSGAYARTSSPLGFLSHNAPAEIMVSDGRATLIRRRGEPEDFLQDQLKN